MTTLSKSRCNLAEKLLNQFIKKYSYIAGDAKVYSQVEWDDYRREKYGRNAYATMVIDGSGFYEMFNWYSLKKELEEFHKMLEEHKFYFELGEAWSVHVYDA